MKRTLLACVVAAFSASVFANSFQHQSDIDFAWGEFSNGNLQSTDLQSWHLQHHFYLAPVDVNNNFPFAEAAFVGRNSSVNGSYVYNGFDVPGSDFSISGWSLGGEYMDTAHKYYAAITFDETNNTDSREMLASAGYFVQSDWLVKIDVRHNRPDGSGSDTDYGLSTKKLMTLEGGQFINIEASVLELSDRSGSEYGVAADYYFNRSISVGLAYDWISKDIIRTEEDSLMVRGNWFIQPNLALKASVVFDYAYSNDELYHLGASYRF